MKNVFTIALFVVLSVVGIWFFNDHNTITKTTETANQKILLQDSLINKWKASSKSWEDDRNYYKNLWSDVDDKLTAANSKTDSLSNLVLKQDSTITDLKNVLAKRQTTNPPVAVANPKRAEQRTNDSTATAKGGIPPTKKKYSE